MSDRIDSGAYFNANNNDTNDKEGGMFEFELSVLHFLNYTMDKMMISSANDQGRSRIIKTEVFLLSHVLASPFRSIATPALPPQLPQVSNNPLGSGNGTPALPPQLPQVSNNPLGSGNVVFDLSGKKTDDISFFPGKTADVTDDMESMGSFTLQKDDKLLDDLAADGKATCYSEAERLQQSLTVNPTKFDHAARGLEFETNGGVPPSKIHSPTHVAGLTQATGLVARRVFSPMASVTSQELRPTLMDLVMCSTYSNTMNPILNMDLDTGLAGNNSGSILKSFQNEFDRLEKANMDSQLFCDVYHLVNLLVSFLEECVNNDVNVLTLCQNELDELVFDDKRGFQSANIVHHLFATIDNPETLYSISDCLAFNLLNIKHEYERYVGRMNKKPFKFGHIIHFVVLMILHENRLFLQAQKNESLEAVVVNHELLEYYPEFQFYVLKVTSVILATRMCKQNPMGQSGN